MGNTVIIYAPRPGKPKAPVRRTSPPLAVQPVPITPEPAVAGLVPSSAALDAFTDMLDRWHLPAERGWRMLTGQAMRPKALTQEQARRVQLLLTMEAMLSSILTRVDVGAWLVESNPGPLLNGMAPVDYLTEVGTPGYLSLLRQVRRWAAM